MSEYAEIVEGKVIRVLVISNDWTEVQTLDFLSTISSNTWKKTNKKVGSLLNIMQNWTSLLLRNLLSLGN